MNTKTESKKNILVLPRWYPNETDVQLGIFIQRQLVLMAPHANFTVVYAQALTTQKERYRLVSQQTVPGLNEYLIYFRSARGPFRKIINLIRYQKAQRKGLKIAQDQWHCSHVHVPYRSALPALRLKRKHQVPFLITEHWSGHLNGLYKNKNSVDQWLYRKVLAKATRISTVSFALKKAFATNTGFNSEVIPNYIEVRPAEPNAKEDDKIHILTVGDLIDRTKNITGLLRAFNQVLSQNDQVHLTIIGGGPDETLISKMVAQLGIPAENIHLTGRQDHEAVLRAMHSCDFYVCNSRHETFGMTVAEALLCGKPVISTRCGGPEEFLTPSNSLTVAIDKEEELVAALTTMVATYAQFNNAAISQEINNRFNPEKVQQQWLDFYQLT